MSSDTDTPRLLAFIAELRRILRPLEESRIDCSELAVTLIEKDGSVRSELNMKGRGHTTISKNSK